MNLNQCDECYIRILSGHTLYRAFDNTYCSKLCLQKICCNKDNIEQENQRSSNWPGSETDHLINIPTVHSITEEIYTKDRLHTNDCMKDYHLAENHRIENHRIEYDRIDNYRMKNHQSKYNDPLHTYNHKHIGYMYKISMFGYLYFIISSVGIFGLKTLLNTRYQLPNLI